MIWASVHSMGGFVSQNRSGQQSQECADQMHNSSNMAETLYRGRRATSIENEWLRVTVLQEGGHIAEILDKQSGVNPLWTPPWESIEPSTYDLPKHPEYGADSESKLLGGIMGHNLCMDIFGPPSAEEAAAGLTVHGEASVASYDIASTASGLDAAGAISAVAVAIGTAHRTGGPDRGDRRSPSKTRAPRTGPSPGRSTSRWGRRSLRAGATQFRAPITQSFVLDPDNGDFQLYTEAPVSGGFATHLLDTSRDSAFFVAWSPGSKVALGYLWQRSDFPWLGVWEENHKRTGAPWNGRTMTRGMEFGASPLPESRRQMIDRGTLFSVPAFRWIPARTRVQVRYCAALQAGFTHCPAAIVRGSHGEVRFED